MDRLIYTAVAALESHNVTRANITHSLANVSTVGFKKSIQLAETAVAVGSGAGNTRVQPRNEGKEYIDLTSGPRQNTGRNLDIAMNEETVMGVQAPNGDIAFTRRGDLRVTAEGLLETGQGHAVLGENGPITVPVGQMINIAPDGSIFAQAGTGADSAPVVVGQILLRDASETRLIRREDTLFEPEVTAGLGIDFESGPKPASLTSGSLEGSNANPVEVMVELMDFTRKFESQIKIIAEMKKLDESGATMIRSS
jgi:flagellar basal-body rod protein FlgF